MNLDWYRNLEWFQKKGQIKKILFVCSANTCRSASAEYFFNSIFGFGGIKAFSRGIRVAEMLQRAKVQELPVEPETKKVIKDLKLYSSLEKHKATQISEQDVKKADLVLTVDRSTLELLKSGYPEYDYKIFTLIGFVDKTEFDKGANLDLENPFVPPNLREERGIIEGKKGYYKYIQNYVRIFDDIKKYVRKLIEVLYLLETEE